MITVAEIIVLQVVQGVINAFDTPARQAFVVEMVEDRDDLPNAIALNSSMVNASRIIGPSIGGVLIAARRRRVVLRRRRDLVPRRDRVAAGDALGRRASAHASTTRMLEELRTGFDYVVALRCRCARCCCSSRWSASMGMPYTVLMPVIAAKVLHGGPHTLGF